jgi:DNA-binding SARP family transcriptional activator/CheY-like chemotaxis protein
MVSVEFRLLGRVEAWRDGRPVELGGRKQRAVLASLLLRVGRVVSLDRIIDDLWPDRPPARAAATVQVFVSNLRRALEPARPRGAAATLLVTASPGYRLDVEPSAVDARVFADLAERGRAALADEDAERAAALLRRAEDLWRGPALADLAEAPFARAAAARLDELRLGAVDDRVDADLALGRHAALVAELEQSVRDRPMRERPRAQLMLALYRSGRQAEALSRYRDARRILHEELGLEPGRQLRELERAVLRQDPDLAWQPPPVTGAAPVAGAALAAGADLAAGGAPVAGVAPATGGDGRPTERPGRVLVVDDTGINRTLLVAALTGLGHEAHAVENGRRALDALRAAGDGPDGYDIVLLDLLMPVLDGYHTLAAMKADPALAGIPVIMVSAVPDLESVVRCIELGAVDYLPKPFSAAMLRARLRSSLSARRTATDREAALRSEIAALRAEVARARIGAGPERP